MKLDSSFPIANFLQQYWQQRPLVITQMLKPFADPIDEHDLAGLAQEEGIDSRIICADNNDQWSMTHGPFEDFADVCKDKWTLLVQATDRYFPEVSELMELFRFIPYWRMDDVMISYSVAGAGVGAHVDQYDVFLVQGKGARRWQVAKPSETLKEVNNAGIRQVTSFDPIIDVTMQPGDVLYIPPGWPHKGETIEDALTYSIGFRAPDTEQLSTTLCDTLADNVLPNSRYTDKTPYFSKSPTQVSGQEIAALKQQLINAIQSAQFDAVLVQSLSEQHLLIEPEDIIDTSALCALFSEKVHYVQKREGLRPLLFKQQNKDPHVLAFVNGEAYPLPAALEQTLEALFTGDEVALYQAISANDRKEYLQAMEDWINKGYVLLT